jgi:hypothetical protein
MFYERTYWKDFDKINLVDYFRSALKSSAMCRRVSIVFCMIYGTKYREHSNLVSFLKFVWSLHIFNEIQEQILSEYAIAQVEE